MSKEYVILKGVNTYYSGYPTDTVLEGDSSYIEYSGLFLDLDKGIEMEGSNTTFSNGFKTNNNKVRQSFTIRSRPITYPEVAVNFDDFISDGTESINEVLSSKYLYIQNDQVRNNNDTRFWFVPIGTTDQATKNRAITCVGGQIVREEFWYYIQLNMELAKRFE